MEFGFCDHAVQHVENLAIRHQVDHRSIEGMGHGDHGVLSTIVRIGLAMLRSHKYLMPVAIAWVTICGINLELPVRFVCQIGEDVRDTHLGVHKKPPSDSGRQ
jgi:hypothetical protein